MQLCGLLSLALGLLLLGACLGATVMRETFKGRSANVPRASRRRSTDASNPKAPDAPPATATPTPAPTPAATATPTAATSAKPARTRKRTKAPDAPAPTATPDAPAPTATPTPAPTPATPLHADTLPFGTAATTTSRADDPTR